MATPVFTGAALTVNGAPTDIHTSQKNPLGLRVFGYDINGNAAEYIYLGGVASTIVGSWVIYSAATYLTTLGVANSKGRVAVAMAAVTAATNFGFYQIHGLATGSVA